jgi:hypothetical protein
MSYHYDMTYPTLNPTYNRMLKHWKELGSFHDAVCESCHRSLVNQPVYQVSTAWMCEECFELQDEDTTIDATPYITIVNDPPSLEDLTDDAELES